MPLAIQRSFDELGTPLIEETFVVFDLETTGAVAESCGITEIGAVKVRGGEVLGEFQTLVNPGVPIPAMITMLTGITDEMVADAPPLEQVLPLFLSWLEGAVLVAHNAAFDIGFLRASARALELPDPKHHVVCTVRLARRLVHDEVHNLKLSTLATAFGARTSPCHRALADARATVDVFHTLLGRCGTWGIEHTDELLWFQGVKGHPAYRKVHLFEPLPAARGVYLFVDETDRVLYVGKATDLRTRVRSYFGDTRRRIGELLQAFHRVDHVVCATDLDASVLEARLIRAHAPPFNRAQRGRGGSPWWLTLTDERFPRLSRSKQPKGPSIGPLSSRQADLVKEAIEEGARLRSCTDRITTKPSRAAACVRGQVGSCAAPCVDPSIGALYEPAVLLAREALTEDPSSLLEELDERMRSLGERDLFEQAATTRDRTGALVRSLIVARRLRALAAAGELDIAIGSTRLTLDEGFVTAVDGRPMPVAADGHHDEPRLVAAWLARNTHRVRILEASGAFASPRPGGATLTAWDQRLRALASV
jgi:DNA polymerase-3 subunit epsilon